MTDDEAIAVQTFRNFFTLILGDHVGEQLNDLQPVLHILAFCQKKIKGGGETIDHCFSKQKAIVSIVFSKLLGGKSHFGGGAPLVPPVAESQYNIMQKYSSSLVPMFLLLKLCIWIPNH